MCVCVFSLNNNPTTSTDQRPQRNGPPSGRACTNLLGPLMTASALGASLTIRGVSRCVVLAEADLAPPCFKPAICGLLGTKYGAGLRLLMKFVRPLLSLSATTVLGSISCGWTWAWAGFCCAALAASNGLGARAATECCCSGFGGGWLGSRAKFALVFASALSAFSTSVRCACVFLVSSALGLLWAPLCALGRQNQNFNSVYP